MAKPLRLGVAGLGVVGTSLIRLLQRRRAGIVAQAGRHCVLAAYSARRPREPGVDLGDAIFYDNAAALAASADIDIFVELIGGADGIAFEAVKAALARGLPVVTANKAMLAAHGLTLAALSESHNAPLFFEAAVAGGIPVVKTLRESLAGNTIQRVSGILNGTCNYILSRMETENLPFDVCLSEAQRLGYAEADPTFDVGGFDTAHKLAILASLAFGSKIDAGAVSVEGIELITLADLAAADELGFRIKLLGVAERTAHGVEQRVHPTMVAKSAPLAQTMGVLNAVSIDGDAVGELTLVGPGAGGRRDRIVGRGRHRRHRARNAPARVRAAGGRSGRRRPCADAAPRGRLLCAPGGRRPPGRDGRDRRADSASGSSRSRRSCKSARPKEAAAAGRRSCRADDPRHHRSLDPRGAGAHGRGWRRARKAAGHPNRTRGDVMRRQPAGDRRDAGVERGPRSKTAACASSRSR